MLANSRLAAKIAFCHVLLLVAVFYLGSSLRHKESVSSWLDAIAGTLSFPAVAYSRLRVQGSEARPPLVFEWWSSNVFDTPLLVLCANVVLWAFLLSWVWSSLTRSSTRPSIAASRHARCVGAMCVVALIALNFICYSLFLTIEYTAEWRDFIAVFGTLATLLAFAIAMQQILHAQRLADAARAATATDRAHFFRFALAEGHRLFAGAGRHVNTNTNYRWLAASEYLDLAADMLTTAHKVCEAADAPAIQDVLTRIRSQSTTFQKIPGGHAQFSSDAWSSLANDFMDIRVKYITPLPNF